MIVTGSIEVKCSVCGTASTQVIAKGVKKSGVPDIDFRPNDEYRQGMRYWAMECPMCGYCNATLDIKLNADRSFLESDEYRKLGGIKSDDEIATKLIKRAVCDKKNGNFADAVQSYMYASWVFDDNSNEELATECRKASIAVMDENSSTFENDQNLQLLKADLLRRSGEFERVISEYSGRKFSSPLMQAISDFQVKLAEKGDRSAHRADEIEGVRAK